MNLAVASGDSNSDLDPRPAPKYFWKIVLTVAAFLTVPLMLIFVLFPLMIGQPFNSVDELKVEEIESMKVNLLNRKELDDGGDVPRFSAAPEDFAALLEPLRGVPETRDFERVRGPWLGEYRIWMKDGRRGNIKIYYIRSSDGLVKIHFQIGPHKYEGGSAAKLIAAAESAATRARN